MIQRVSADALRSVERVTVTRVVVLRGGGTEDDPVREVTMIFNDAGECVAEHDPRWPTPWYAPESALRCRPTLAPLP